MINSCLDQLSFYVIEKNIFEVLAKDDEVYKTRFEETASEVGSIYLAFVVAPPFSQFFI